MKLGLIADVRGLMAPLRVALDILAAAGCERVACVGSTVEGGAEDEAVLATLEGLDALLLPCPHDAAPVAALPPVATLAGLELAHAVPDSLVPDETLWLTGYAVPSILAVREHHGARPSRRICGDTYAPLAWFTPDDGPARRRVFLARETVSVPAGSLLACPGSVAMARGTRRGGSVMAWDDTRSELEVIPFDERGARAESGSRARILVYCDAFDEHRPDERVLAGVDLVVRDSADQLQAEVAAEQPDLVLLDYHLKGRSSGLDALIELKAVTGTLPVPVFTISGNPTDNESMKSAGATGSLPFAYLGDVLTRLVSEISGVTP